MGLALVGAPTAEAAMLFGNDFDGRLYDIDPLTGKASNPRSTGIIALSGITFSPSGTLYGLRAGFGPDAALYTINPGTGAATRVGPTGVDIAEGDLAFDPITGALYAVQDRSSRLLRLDPTTGAATVIGSSIPGRFPDLSAMAFDANGNLYVWDTENQRLLQLDKDNAVVINSIPLNRSLSFLAGMAFHPETGELFAAEGFTIGTSDLYTLDPQTGVFSLRGPSFSISPIAGLAFAPPIIPEPSTLSLFVLGTFGLIGYVWRWFSHPQIRTATSTRRRR